MEFHQMEVRLRIEREAPEERKPLARRLYEILVAIDSDEDEWTHFCYISFLLVLTLLGPFSFPLFIPDFHPVSWLGVLACLAGAGILFAGSLAFLYQRLVVLPQRRLNANRRALDTMLASNTEGPEVLQWLGEIDPLMKSIINQANQRCTPPSAASGAVGATPLPTG